MCFSTKYYTELTKWHIWTYYRFCSSLILDCRIVYVTLSILLCCTMLLALLEIVSYFFQRVVWYVQQYSFSLLSMSYPLHILHSCCHKSQFCCSASQIDQNIQSCILGQDQSKLAGPKTKVNKFTLVLSEKKGLLPLFTQFLSISSLRVETVS